MTVEERDKVIKSIIIILLGGKMEEQLSLQRELEAVVLREVADMAILRMGGTKTEDVSYSAVVTIAANLNLRAITDFAIGKCLEIYEIKKLNFLRLGANEPLDTATKLAYYNASLEVIEKVIATIAENGWYGRIEAMVRELLNRGLTSSEVMLLVKQYVNDKGHRSEDQEQRLIVMAQIYVPEKVAEVRGKIRKFAEDFNRDDCY